MCRKIVVMGGSFNPPTIAHQKLMLLATGDAVLKEGNTWNDVFWGVSLKTGQGENNLGKILMRVREKLHSEVI